MTFDPHHDTHSETWESHASDKVRDPTRMRRPALTGQSISILADLGMSDAQIARYFHVSQDQVLSLRRYYGLA